MFDEFIALCVPTENIHVINSLYFKFYVPHIGCFCCYFIVVVTLLLLLFSVAVGGDGKWFVA